MAKLPQYNRDAYLKIKLLSKVQALTSSVYMMSRAKVIYDFKLMCKYKYINLCISQII